MTPSRAAAAAAPLSRDAEAEGNPFRAVLPEAAWWKRALGAAGSALEWVFGFAVILVAVAACAVVPVFHFLSLGYLLEVSGRVAASGRWRDAFIGVRKAAALGGLAAGLWLVSLPARFAAGMRDDARLVALEGNAAALWQGILVLVTALGLAHLVWAMLRGGRLRHFLWPAPWRFLRALRRARPAALLEAAGWAGDWVAGLRLPYFFWLGARGFAAALAWLAVPGGILMLAGQVRAEGPAFLLTLLGAALLMAVAMWLPFLQARFACSGRFRAMFEVGAARDLFRRAPVAFWIALVVTLLFALPLYLLKIELPPREAAWLPALVFVALIFPARVLAGWALSRGQRREKPRHWSARWLARLAALPVAALYVFFVWLSQYLSWHGALGLLEQHAFLVPTPLLGL